MRSPYRTPEFPYKLSLVESRAERYVLRADVEPVPEDINGKPVYIRKVGVIRYYPDGVVPNGPGCNRIYIFLIYKITFSTPRPLYLAPLYLAPLRLHSPLFIVIVDSWGDWRKKRKQRARCGGVSHDLCRSAGGLWGLTIAGRSGIRGDNVA